MTVTEWIRAIRGSPQARHLAIVKRPFQGAYPRKRSTPTMCLHESAKFLCHRGGSWGIPYLFRHDFCRSQISGSGNPPPHCRYESIHIGRICPGKGLLPTRRKRLFGHILSCIALVLRKTGQTPPGNARQRDGKLCRAKKNTFQIFTRTPLLLDASTPRKDRRHFCRRSFLICAFAGAGNMCPSRGIVCTGRMDEARRTPLWPCDAVRN